MLTAVASWAGDRPREGRLGRGEGPRAPEQSSALPAGPGDDLGRAVPSAASSQSPESERRAGETGEAPRVFSGTFGLQSSLLGQTCR